MSFTWTVSTINKLKLCVKNDRLLVGQHKGQTCVNDIEFSISYLLLHNKPLHRIRDSVPHLPLFGDFLHILWLPGPPPFPVLLARKIEFSWSFLCFCER